MTTWLGAFVRKNLKWIVIGILLVIIGICLGWRIAGRLAAGGLVIGGAATGLVQAHTRRNREARRLARERADIEKSARETDEMIQEYRRGRGDRR